MADDGVRSSSESARAVDRRRAFGEAVIAGIATTALLVVSVYGLWGASQRTHREQMRADLSRLASTMATLVDPALHEQVRRAGAMDTPAYLRAVEALRRARLGTPGLRYVYTVELRADSVRFILDTAEPGDHDGDGREDRSAIGEVYDSPDLEMLEALGSPSQRGRATATASPTTDAWGTWVSGYAPLIDASGRQLGAVGIDVDAKHFLAQEAAVRRAMLFGLFPGALLVLGLTFGAYRLRRHQLSSLRRTLNERQKAADAAHLASQQARRTRAIIDGTGVLAWEYDLAEDRFTYLSATGTGFGYTTTEWLSPGFLREATNADDRERVEAFLREGRVGAEQCRCEFRLRGTNQRDIWMEMVVSPAHEGQSPSVVSGVLIDVSEAHALRVAAEAASRSKSEFLANMSHEIRTPLTAILGYTELLREDGDAHSAPPARLQTIDTIRTAGQYLLAVISDILDLSKIEAGRMTVETVSVDLPRLFVECENLLRPRAVAKGLAFSVALDTPVPQRAITDPTRLRQIILNLAGNAIKFTTSGHVTLRVTMLHPDEPVQTLRIDVEDSGPGLTEEQASRLFQAFSQADNSVTRTHGGTGLGLTISRRLASLMGGDVRLHRAAPGEGCTFRIDVEVIPSADADCVTSLHNAREFAPRSTGSARADGPPRLSGRVLVAEDNPVNQRLLEVFLGKAGARVELVADGANALEHLERAERDGTPFDLLLTDMQMPVMDGYTLVRALRARGSALPIVALTANAMSEDRQQCLDAGCDDYLPKPIDLHGLLRTCARWIDADRSNAHSPLALVGDVVNPPGRGEATVGSLRQTA